MKKIFAFLLLGFVLNVNFALANTNTSATNDGDTFLDSENPTTAQGSQTFMLSAESYGANRKLLIKFTLPVQPGDASGQPTAAKLFLYDTNIYGDTTRTFTLCTLSADFTESTATYNNYSPACATTISTTETKSNGAGWKSFDISTLGLQWGNSVRLMLYPNGSTAGWQGFYVYSKENGSNTPYLELTYSPAGGGGGGSTDTGTKFNIASSVLFTLASTTATSTEYFLTENGYLLLTQNHTQMNLFNGFILFFITAFGFIGYFAYKLTKK